MRVSELIEWRRVMVQLPAIWSPSLRIYFDRNFNVFWLEDGAGSCYWKLPARR